MCMEMNLDIYILNVNICKQISLALDDEIS